MRKEAKSILIHTIAGLIVGSLTKTIDGKLLLIIGFAVLFALREATMRVFKPEEKNFWAANGLMQYLFTWLAVAVIALNV